MNRVISAINITQRVGKNVVAMWLKNIRLSLMEIWNQSAISRSKPQHDRERANLNRVFLGILGCKDTNNLIIVELNIPAVVNSTLH